MAEFNRFDAVQILTTKNVTWISSDDQYNLSPKGLWSVVQVFDKNLLISKDKNLVQIPIEDVKKIGEYDLSKVLKNIKGFVHGRRRREEQETRKEESEADLGPIG